MEKKNDRVRSWVGTINNLQFSDAEYLDKFKSIPGVKYFCGQREKAPTTGKEHIQFFIDFADKIYFTELQALFKDKIHSGIHFERRKAKTKQEAHDYALKEGKWENDISRAGEKMRFGELVEERERTDMAAIIERIKQGATNIELLDEFPTQFFRYKKHIEAVRRTFQEHEHGNKYRELRVFYISGVPRTGKTTFITKKYGKPNVCRVVYEKGWYFENYRGQDVLLFDEFNGQIAITLMNEYLDVWLDSLRCRNEDKIPLYTKAYVISNKPFASQYTDIQTNEPEVWQAFKLRFNGGFINWDNAAEREYFKLHGEAMPKQPPKQLRLADLKPLPDDDPLYDVF